MEHLADEITTLAAHLSAATARWLALIAEFDAADGWAESGCKSCAAWLSWSCGLAPMTAREHVRVARRLQALPLVAAAFGRGELSFSKVRALTRVEEVEDERELVSLARHATAGQLERIVRGYRSVLVVEEGAERAYAERSVTWSWDDDGTLVLRGRLPGEQGALLVAALEAARDAVGPPPREQERSLGVSAETFEPTLLADPERPPTVAARNADALLAVAETSLASDARGTTAERYMVVVHVDADALASPPAAHARAAHDSLADSASAGLGAGADSPRVGSGSGADSAPVRLGSGADFPPVRPASGADSPPAGRGSGADSPPAGLGWAADSPVADVGWAADSPVAGLASGAETPAARCELDAGVPLARSVARRLACDASLVRIVERDGRPLSIGRRTRAIAPALRRALHARAPGCAFPGCTQTRHLDAHHVRHWADGGRTDVDNLVQLCRHHHRLLHEGGFSMRRDGAGHAFFAPDGRRLSAAPRPPRGDRARLLAENHRTGLRVSAETTASLGRGERVDLGLAVDALLQIARSPQRCDEPAAAALAPAG